MPGRHVVALSATSVSWLIAMPGAISMNARRLFLERHEPGAHGLQEPGQLRLQRVEHRERTKLHRARTLPWYGQRRADLAGMKATRPGCCSLACSSPTPSSPRSPMPAPRLRRARRRDAPPGPCAAGMAQVDTFCIDQYEGALEEQQTTARGTQHRPICRSARARARRPCRRHPAAGLHLRRRGAAPPAPPPASGCARRPNGSRACRGPKTRRSRTATRTVAGACNDATAATRSSTTSARRRAWFDSST